MKLGHITHLRRSFIHHLIVYRPLGQDPLGFLLLSAPQHAISIVRSLITMIQWSFPVIWGNSDISVRSDFANSIPQICRFQPLTTLNRFELLDLFLLQLRHLESNSNDPTVVSNYLEPATHICMI